MNTCIDGTCLTLNILGISAFYHDSAACLLRDGEIVAAAQEERFSRIKHDSSYPVNAITYCLKEAGLKAEDLDIVGYYEKPLLKLDRIIETLLTVAPRALKIYMKGIPLWLSDRLWVTDYFEENFGIEPRMAWCAHHQSHAAAAFFASGFEKAAILTADGVGEWATTSAGVGAGNSINLLREIHFPHSLGMLYTAFTYYIGFRVNSGEYKLMGLAPYGEPEYVDTILRELIDVKDDGSFRLNMKYFGYLTSERMINRKFEELFGGPPRRPEGEIEQRHLNLARSIQEVTEMVMLRLARSLHEETGLDNLCMAGGVSLNCVANGKILRESGFRRLFIQPAAGDAGGALGAALFLWHRYQNQPRNIGNGKRDIMRGTYLGPGYSNEEIHETLKKRQAPAKRFDRRELIERTAEMIAEGKVVGWFQGRMEFGPRALGARSILGDARKPEMQSLINRKIKFRESFRPFAPSVLAEYASEYFELDGESPYMLLTAPVREVKRRVLTDEEKRFTGLDKQKVARSVIPAVTHVDWSARLQTVRREDNPIYYDLIAEFNRLTGCPVIINTSFNVRGEPIVCSPEEAYDCFLRTEMDSLVIGTFVVEKSRVPVEQRARVPQGALELD